MKKSLQLFMLLTPLLISAQVTIGSGTRLDTNAGLSTPISIWYGYSLSQQIYLASEIGGPMTIEELKFHNRNPITSLSNTADIDVWIGHIEESSFANVVSPTGAAWIPVANQEKVMNYGSLSFNDNEVIITLETPFEYNGMDNLVITVDENRAGHNGNSYTFYQTVDYSEDVSLINRNDQNNPNPLNPPTIYTGPNSTSTSEVQGKKYKAILTLIGESLGVKEIKTVGDAQLSPNPVTDILTIATKLNISSLEIYDLTGKKIAATIPLNDNKINITELNAGMYLLKINYIEGITSTKKIIKK